MRVTKIEIWLDKPVEVNEFAVVSWIEEGLDMQSYSLGAKQETVEGDFGLKFDHNILNIHVKVK
jgi:hypothetical protein